jgi:hypothetical protein
MYIDLRTIGLVLAGVVIGMALQRIFASDADTDVRFHRFHNVYRELDRLTHASLDMNAAGTLSDAVLMEHQERLDDLGGRLETLERWQPVADPTERFTPPANPDEDRAVSE